MVNRYVFYFDESFHDRVITTKAILANDFYNSYTSVGIGIMHKDKEKGLRKFEQFEEKYKKIYQVDELKSEVITKKKYEKGIASFKPQDVDLYTELFEILYKNDFVYYIFSCDKVEYILEQCNYYGATFLNMAAVIYTICKAINTYKPQNVLNDLLNKKESFIDDLKEFLERKVLDNKGTSFKQKESEAYSLVSTFLGNISASNVNYNFSYDYTFMGLEELIKELHSNVDNTEVIIDKEGTGKILAAAKRNNFKNSRELDSKVCLGIRIADLVSGFFSRLMQGVYISMYNDPDIPYKEKHYIPVEWFKINKKQFLLYKTLAKYLKKYNDIYYATYVNICADLLICAIAVIYYFDQFNTYEDYIKVKKEEHYIEGNNFIINRIKEHLIDIEKMKYI